MKFVIKVLDTASSLSKSSTFNQKSKPKKSSKELKTYNLPTTTIFIPTRKSSKSSTKFFSHANLENISKVKQQTTTTYNKKLINSTKTVISKNDDIFLLQPDSIDYGDLLSQFITISSNSNSQNSEKRIKNKLLNDDIKRYNNSASLREYELTNLACSQLKPICFYFKLTTSCFILFLFEFLFFNKFIFS